MFTIEQKARRTCHSELCTTVHCCLHMYTRSLAQVDLDQEQDVTTKANSVPEVHSFECTLATMTFSCK
jgi:hypothetical protein